MQKKLWAVGHMGEAKARGEAGLLTASVSLATKDGATVKEPDGVRGARWSAGSREGYFDP